MTDHVAPQEDQLNLPAAWNARLLPWRGKRAGKPVELADPKLVERRRRKIEERAEKLRTALALPRNKPFVEAAEAFLDGRADPRGAAAVAALLTDGNARMRESRLRPEFDLWVIEHGLPFAAAAAVERLAIVEDDRSYLSGAIEDRVITECPAENLYHADREIGYGGIAAVRSLLASASDTEYAEVVAAVTPHRDTAAKRVAAMLLFPGEHEWVLEGCTVYGNNRTYRAHDAILWHSISRPEHAAAARLTNLDDHLLDLDIAAPLLAGLGAAALPILIETAHTAYYYAEAKKLLYRSIAMVPSDDAMAFLLEKLDRPHVFELATEAAGRFPVRALRIAASLAPTLPDKQRRQVTAIANAIDPAHHEHLNEAERAVLADLLADTGRFPAAALEELPPLLVAPPWTLKRPKVKRVVIDGLEPPAGSRLRWAEGEQEAWSKARNYYDLDEGYWSDEKTIEADDWRLLSFLGFAEIERAEPLLEHWTGEARYGGHSELQRVLARFGERVIDRVLKLPATDHTHLELPGPILNTAAARIAAERLTRLKSARPSARKWFERHGLDTVAHLVPDALGADKKRRGYAESALAHLAVRHGAEAVSAEAEPYGPEAVEAITALLGVDPLEPIVKIPKPGPWAVPVILPQVLLKGGERALPAEAVPHLITVLALGTPDNDYPGVEVVAETCDRASLTRFSQALFDQWLSVGGPSKDAWALTQLANFADDATVWRLAPLIREWPGQSQHKRAVTGLEVLGAIGTEEAMRAIQIIAEKVKFKALKEEAGRQISHIAEGLGLSREQLADRLVPDFGLGEEAALVLDYGPRTFIVGLRRAAQAVRHRRGGKLRKALPKPGAKDDPEIAAGGLPALRRLEEGAADGRRRPGPPPRGRHGRRPGLVGGRVPAVLRRAPAHRAPRPPPGVAGRDGGHRFGFRIAEDGTFGDVEDEAVELARDGAHPRRAPACTWGPSRPRPGPRSSPTTRSCSRSTSWTGPSWPSLGTSSPPAGSSASKGPRSMSAASSA